MPIARQVACLLPGASPGQSERSSVVPNSLGLIQSAQRRLVVDTRKPVQRAAINDSQMIAYAAGPRAAWARNGSWGAKAARIMASLWSINSGSSAKPPWTISSPSKIRSPRGRSAIGPSRYAGAVSRCCRRTGCRAPWWRPPRCLPVPRRRPRPCLRPLRRRRPSHPRGRRRRRP